MVRVKLPFGDSQISIQMEDSNLAQVLTPRNWQPLEDLESELHKALNSPLEQAPLWEWVKPSDRVLILSDDNTRLTPAHRLLPPLLDGLGKAGVPKDRISILMALGTHRPMTQEEMRVKVGDRVYGAFRVFNHDWRDPNQLVELGTSSQGTPLWVNKAALEADLIIGLGAIVPHHIPGFSGSSKIVQPGICGAITTAETHLLSTRGEDSLLGLEDNPVRRDMDDMAERVGMKSILNVVLNPEGQVAGVFFGKMKRVFQEGVKLARKIYGIPFYETPDVVIANSCPCDIDFWQSHKALYPAARMVKPGGSIIVITPAPEGVSPVHTGMLKFTAWPSQRIERAYRSGQIRNGVATALAVAWAKVREKAQVILVSPGISVEDKKRLGFVHAQDPQEALKEAFKKQGPEARVAVLTHAPDTLPVKAF
ncbi:MAG: nickel-dependent lactate racemase [bacterium]